MNWFLDGHRKFTEKVLPLIDPEWDWRSHPMVATHDDHGAPGARYNLVARAPKDWTPPMTGESSRVEKSATTDCPGGRWITVHPHGPEEDGQPVYICPNPDGTHTIAGGAGGKLNGLRLLGVKSPEEYAAHAREIRVEKKRQAKAHEELQKRQMGVEAFEKQRAEKAAAMQDVAAGKVEAERGAIAAVFAAQGIDPSFMTLPPHVLAGAEPKTVATLNRRYHEKLFTYAKNVAGAVRGLVAAGIDGMAEGTVGDLGIGDLATASTGDSGSGYMSPIRALSDDLGVSPEERNKAVEGMKTRSMLERSDMDLEQAKKRQAENADLQAKRKDSEAKVKSAVADLAEEGLGPEAVSHFSTAPKVETVGQAVSVLTAMKNAQRAGQAAENQKKALDLVDDLSTLPKAAMMPFTPLDEATAKDAIANDLDEEARRSAMTGLVADSNDMEVQGGSLRQHLSVGHNLAFNTILSAVDGSSIDPLVHDILGPNGAAQVVAARWRETMPPDDVDKLAKVLADHHVQTQVAIAKTATQEAGEYLGRVQELADQMEEAGPPDSPEALESGLLLQAQKVGLVKQARETLGIARGRVEAAAALNNALMKPPTDGAAVSLGAVTPDHAMSMAYALGLSDPTLYDKDTGEMTHEGDFDIKHDGKSAVLSISPDGIRKLAGKNDQGLKERTIRSAAIKRGDFDEEDWIPHGLTRRPVSSYESDPLQIRRATDRLDLSDNHTAGDMAEAAQGFIGQLMNAGRDPRQIDSMMRSEEFLASSGLSPEAQNRYLGALRGLSPEWTPSPDANMSDPAVQRTENERYKQWQTDRAATYQGFLAKHLEAKRLAGEIGKTEEALDGQQVPMDATTQDCLYTSMLSDPRTRFAFHDVGDLDREGRASVRRWAYEHMFGLKPGGKDGDNAILTPLSGEQRHAYEAWNKLSDSSGDPYQAIQADWRGTSSDTDLFGDPVPAHPLSTVDLSDDVSVLAAASAAPKMLGYEAQTDSEGRKSIPDLQPTENRPASVIAADARGRIRRALRTHFLENMVGSKDLAAEGWNPTSVRTTSDRWADYARHMGDSAAYQTAQEFMKGSIAEKFAKEYKARTGNDLQLANRPVGLAERHAQAMLSPEARERLDSLDAGEKAKLLNRMGGRWSKTGSIQDLAELRASQQAEGARLFDIQNPEQFHVDTERPTIGSTAESMLAGMAPHLDIGKGSASAARGLNLSTGKGLPIQRAIKLIEQNERQGVNLGTGSGKTVVGIGAHAHLASKGLVKRSLFLVPSVVVDQFPSEIDKFRDPAVPLSKWAASGATPTERRAQLANPNLHVMVMTPEALRTDITAAVAKNEGITQEEATSRIMDPKADESDIHDMIHRAMHAHGYNFDFTLSDEGHRLLQRQGKPDAHMQRVADAVAARSRFFAFSTADPVKNSADEAYSVLNKIDSDRFPQSGMAAFQRKYGRNTEASALALQRVMEPYLYPERTDLGIQTNNYMPDQGALKLTAPQQAAHDSVLDSYKKARIAKLRGGADVESLRALAPNLFAGAVKPSEVRAAADRANSALATLRDAALGKVVNAFPGGAKEEWIVKDMEEHRGEPTVIFAHLKDSVKQIADRLTHEGHSVVTLTGSDSSDAKTRARLAFQPPDGQPASASVIVLSDAGAVGANLYRGKNLINLDVPNTSMLHQQRIGRIRRIGQKAGTVRVPDLVADSEFDQAARRRLEKKSALREIVTSPSSMIDDSGLADSIEQAGLRRVMDQSKQG